MTELQHNLWLISPEIYLAVLAMLLQMIGLNKSLEKFTGWIAIAGMTGVACILWLLSEKLMMMKIADPQSFREQAYAFSNSFVFQPGQALLKLLTVIFGLLSAATYIGYVKAINQPLKSEYLVFIVLSLVGAGVAISASSLIVLFMGLELQALIGYMLAGFDRDRSESSEAGLKYFILGSLSSCLILLGMSFLYGFSGSVLYTKIIGTELNIGIMAGAILLFSGLMTKLSAAPFHMWTPDVYEGSPLPSVIFFASVQKIVIVCVLISLTFIAIVPGAEFTIIIKAVAILSMLTGSIGGAMQTSLKRLVAYSTILNIGFVLIPFAHMDNIGLTPLIYIIIYAVATIGFLALVIIALGERAEGASLNDLHGFAQSNKLFAVLISILIFSLIGIPPFAGFFGKYYVISNAIANEEYLLTGLAVLSSVIAAFYYLKIVKSMYFDETQDSRVARSNFCLSFIAWGAAVFNMIFGFGF